MPSIFHWSSATNIVFPEGIIVPFNDVKEDIEAGWTHFYAIDDLPIKGVASGAGVEGGSDTVSLGTTSIDGGHTGTYTQLSRHCTGTTEPSAYKYRVGTTSGLHDHDATLEYRPACKKLVLMKATKDHYSLPANACVLSINPRPDLTDITPTGKMLGGASSVEADVAEVCRVTTDEDGLHNHHESGCNGVNQAGSGKKLEDTGAGLHDHEFDYVLTDSLKKFYLGLYTSAVAGIKGDTSTIGMWESDTPPSGWAICDGTNDTPDLTDYFVVLDASKIGTYEGDGTISADAQDTSLDNLHDHDTGTLEPTLLNSNGHHVLGYPHDHEVSALASTAFEPKHYTLIFIKPVAPASTSTPPVAQTQEDGSPWTQEDGTTITEEG